MKKFLSLVLALVLTISLFVPSNAASAKSLAGAANDAVGKTNSALNLPSQNWCGYFVGYCINQSTIKSLAGGSISRADSGNAKVLINWACAKKNIGTYYSFSSPHYNRLAGLYKNLSIVAAAVNSYEPMEGDIIVFDWYGRGDAGHYFSHVGVVTGYNPSSKTVTYVDGNSGGNGSTYVKKHTVNKSSNSIIGYIRFKSGVENQNVYTVTFDGNGISGSFPVMRVTNGTMYGDLPTISRTGYTFGGWYTEKSSGSQILPTTTVNLKGNQTLYAHWTKVPTYSTISNGVYTLAPKCASGMRLDVQGAGTEDGVNVQIYESNGTTAQQWEFKHIGDGYYTITSKVSGKVLDVAGGSKASGTNVQQYKYNGTDAQKWRLQDAGGGYYYIIPQLNTNLCLDVRNGDAGNKTNVQVYTANQSNAQKWKLTPAKALCTVTFDANGGTVGTKTMQVPVGGTLNTLPIPTRSGYIFLCWSTANAGGSGAALTQDNYDWLIFDKDTTLHALWKEVKHTHTNGDYFYSDSHPHYKYYTCVTCGEVYTDGSTTNMSSCATCNPPKKEEPQETGGWGSWSSWTTKPYTASATRQVETKEVQTVAAHIEYRYGRYVDQTGTHNCWCAKYLEGLSYISGKAVLDYSNWSTTRYSASGSTWTCGQCNGKHTGVDHVDGQGRSIWKEYRLPGNKPYYWEEAKIVGAQYETQYRYRDWISG